MADSNGLTSVIKAVTDAKTILKSLEQRMEDKDKQKEIELQNLRWEYTEHIKYIERSHLRVIRAQQVGIVALCVCLSGFIFHQIYRVCK